MNKLKTWHYFIGAVICYGISFTLLYVSPEDSEGNFPALIGLLGLVFLIISVVKLSKGKIPAGEKIICPHCKGEAREYRSTAIKILWPLLFLTPKYICIDCKKLFNEPYKEKIMDIKK